MANCKMGIGRGAHNGLRSLNATIVRGYDAPRAGPNVEATFGLCRTKRL